MKPHYRRVLLKLSGEALSGAQNFGIDAAVLQRLVNEIGELVEHKVQVAIVIGGGNLFRGSHLATVGMNRVTGDQIGMLATVMNALALRDALQSSNLLAVAMSALSVSGVIEGFYRERAVKYLEQNNVLIFAGGTGHPFFTTDTTAALRGIEVEADVLLKATKVDGIYTSDPKHDPSAKRFSELTYAEVINQQLAVMDATAVCLCRDYKLPIRVFNIQEPGALRAVIFGKPIGTLVQ